MPTRGSVQLVHYEVIVYADDKHQDGQTVAFTESQEQAAQIADSMRSAGYTAVEIKRFGPAEETPAEASGGTSGGA